MKPCLLWVSVCIDSISVFWPSPSLFMFTNPLRRVIVFLLRKFTSKSSNRNAVCLLLRSQKQPKPVNALMEKKKKRKRESSNVQGRFRKRVTRTKWAFFSPSAVRDQQFTFLLARGHQYSAIVHSPKGLSESDSEQTERLDSVNHSDTKRSACLKTRWFCNIEITDKVSSLAKHFSEMLFDVTIFIIPLHTKVAIAPHNASKQTGETKASPVPEITHRVYNFTTSIIVTRSVKGPSQRRFSLSSARPARHCT